MAKFKVEYTFDGFGTCLIQAKNREEAMEKFGDGEWIEDEDDSRNYEVAKVSKVK